MHHIILFHFGQIDTLALKGKLAYRSNMQADSIFDKIHLYTPDLVDNHTASDTASQRLCQQVVHHETLDPLNGLVHGRLHRLSYLHLEEEA